MSTSPSKVPTGLAPLVLFAMVALSGCSDKPAVVAPELPTAPVSPVTAPVLPETSEAKPKTDREFKPEMLVRFPESSPICQSKEDLAGYLLHSLKGELTKASALFVEQDGEPPRCFMVRPDVVFRVIGVEYNSDDSDMGLLEVVLPKTVASAGAWTLTLAAEQVQQKQARAQR